MTDDLYERYKEALQIGHVAVLRGSLDEALIAYRSAAAIAPSRALPHASLGGALLRLGRLEEALVEYAAAVARAPHDEGALLGQAEALSLAGRRAEAARVLDHVSEIQEAAGRLPEAADTLRRGLELEDSPERARRQRGLRRETRLSAGDQAAEQLLARALRLREEPEVKSIGSTQPETAVAPVLRPAMPALTGPIPGDRPRVTEEARSVDEIPGPVQAEVGRVAAVAAIAGEPAETVAPAGISLPSASGPARAGGPAETGAAQAGELAVPAARAAADDHGGSTRPADVPTSAPRDVARYEPEPPQPAAPAGPSFEMPVSIPDELVPAAVGVMEGAADTALPPGLVRESEHQPTGDELLVAAEAADMAGDEKALRSLLVWTARAYAREGRFDAGLDATHRLLQHSPGDVDAHLVLVELYLARNWNSLAAEKLVLLGRLAELNDDEETRQRLCAVASRAFPRDERLEVLCS